MDSDEEFYDAYDGDLSCDNEMDNMDEMDEDFQENFEENSLVCVSRMPSFETYTADDIVKLMNQYIDDIDSIMEMPATAIRILLSHTKWDRQELLDRLTDDNCEKFFEKAHVSNPYSKNAMKRVTRQKLTCSICFADFSQNEIVGLGCEHEYCKDCWCQYLTIKIMDDGAESICCPAPKCGIVVDDVTIMQLITDENAKIKYQHLMTNSFVQYNHSLRWCPSPGCNFAIKVNHILAYRQNCTCKCGHSFCFNCGDESHDPIPCNLMKNWKKNDNDETIEYLIKYTKSCPKCYSLIEKNGGCNHMSCRMCKHEFCWLCFGDWNKHNSASCNTYKDDSNEKNDKKRLEHYFKRYGTHRKSLKIELGLIENTINSKMIELQGMGKTWNDTQFLMKAVKVLWESRRQLMLTYIFAYYVKSHNQKTIFEVNQADLELATECLSQYFEKELTQANADEIIHNVMDKSSYCERRQKVMQEHIFDGFENGWWTFANL